MEKRKEKRRVQIRKWYLQIMGDQQVESVILQEKLNHWVANK